MMFSKVCGRRTTATVLAGAALLVTGMAGAQTPAALDIDLSKPLHPVSSKLYGMMTEEINYSYDGGLYAEMVRNRTMQEHDWSGIGHWQVVQLGNSAATYKIDQTTGPSAALPTSLMVEVKTADATSPAGVSNDGWWGYALKPDTTYKGSFYAKADSSAIGPVTVSLVGDNSGEAVATATTTAVTGEWAKYEFTLKTGKIAASTENHLRLTVAHPGTLWVDLVSLFPPTYKDRENGNRADLMEMMAAMKPKFLRMPGGNYLEGDDIQDRYDWKRTIGPLVDRATHPSPWNYSSSDGIGLLEFLEWCEDLKIEPVLAVYAGYSLKGVHIHPGPYLEPFVQDALDEIEFLTGDASTKWGAVRTKLGHPAAFSLKYVEIGNEDEFDHSGSYEGRYVQFYKAIKPKYPNLELIATTPVKAMKPDVIDEHYYKNAAEIFGMTKMYDTYDRSGPKIFVGEWATREGSPTTNLGAALGDAAWMTGMERNSDIVVMASYAPLFVNVNPGGMQWSSDLIGYDAASAYGSPSYYAQVMFGQHLGTSVPTSSMTGAGDRVYYSVTNDPAKGTVIVKLVNGTSAAAPVALKISGAGSIEKGATVWTLAGKSTAETNTLTNPKRLVPVESTIKDAGASFSHTVPAYSVQVLELKVK